MYHHYTSALAGISLLTELGSTQHALQRTVQRSDILQGIVSLCVCQDCEWGETVEDPYYSAASCHFIVECSCSAAAAAATAHDLISPIIFSERFPAAAAAAAAHFAHLIFARNVFFSFIWMGRVRQRTNGALDRRPVGRSFPS